MPAGGGEEWELLKGAGWGGLKLGGVFVGTADNTLYTVPPAPYTSQPTLTPSTLNPNPTPYTVNHAPSDMFPISCIPNPEPEPRTETHPKLNLISNSYPPLQPPLSTPKSCSLNPTPYTPNPTPYVLHPKSHILHSKPQPPNPRLSYLNPKRNTRWTSTGGRGPSSEVKPRYFTP